MARIFLGVIVGVVLAALAFVLFDKPLEEAPPPSLAAARALPAGESVVPIEDESPITEGEGTASDTSTVVAETSKRIRSESSAAEDPIPVLDGIELRGTVGMLHRLLEQEATDYSWAEPMEADLYDYFFERSKGLSNNFGVPNVVCRQTLCEIQVIGYGQDSLEVWEAATSDMTSQPWAEEIIEMRLGGNPIGAEATGLVLIIKRDDVDSTTQAATQDEATI